MLMPPTMTCVILLFLSSLSLIAAHVSVSPTQVPNAGTTLLTFNIGHACATDAFTYKMVFTFPPNITSIKPVYRAGWTVNYTSVSVGYKTPAGVDAFRFVFTFIANPGSEIPTWAVETLLFRVTAPTGAGAWSVGSTFAIPVYQYCTGDMLNAWNSTTPSDSHSERGALPAPTITILDPTEIQQYPSQANVRALAAQLVALTSSGSGSSPSSASSSSSWLRADTMSVIAMILGGVGLLATFILASRLQVVEKQNLILREKWTTQPSQPITTTMDENKKHTVSFHAQE